MAFRRLLLLLSAGVLAACSSGTNAVRIAVAVPLTGDLSAGGQGVLRAVELAVEDARKAGDLRVPVEVVAFDDRADPRTAAGAARLILSDPRVAAVVGHYTSGCSMAAAPLYAGAGLAMLSPAATNPRLTLAQTEPGWPGPRNVFRMVPSDSIQGPMAAEFAVRRLHLRSFAVLHDGTPYGQRLAEEFSKSLRRLGGKVVLSEDLSPLLRDFQAALSRARWAKPAAIYFGGTYPEFGLLLSQARAMGMELPFFAGDGARAQELFDVAGESAQGAYFTSPGLPLDLLERGRSFVEAYKRRYPGAEIGPFDAFAYDAARAVLAALRKAGPDRRRVLEELRTIRLPGLLGEISFDARGDSTSRAVTVYRVDQGRFVPQTVSMRRPRSFVKPT